MGWFSSKTKHYVDTQVQRVIEDNLITNPNLTVILETLLTDQHESVSDAIQDNMLNGSHVKFNRFYRFAERGDYYFGLPDAKFLSTTDGIATALAALESDVGFAVTVDYLYYRPLNNTHIGWQLITETLGYDHDTNELTGLTPSYPSSVYLKKFVAVHATDADTDLGIDQTAMGTFSPGAAVGVTPDRPEWDDPDAKQSISVQTEFRVGTGETESVEIHFTYLDAEGIAVQDFEVLDLTSYGNAPEYYQARYWYMDGVDKIVGYWTYDPTAGTHAGLTNLFTAPTYVDPGTYFPFVVFRKNGVDRADPLLVGTEEFDSTVALLEVLGMDFVEIGEALNEAEGIEDVPQAVMMMGVPIVSTNAQDIEYMWRYFKDIYSRLLPEEAKTYSNYGAAPDLGSSFGTSSGTRQGFALQFSDADFTMGFSFSGIVRSYSAEVIGPVGTVASTNVNPRSIERTLLEVELALYPYVGITPTQERIFKRQITSQIVESYHLVDPQVRYMVDTTFEVSGGAYDERLLIPLDREICRTMSPNKVTQLYQRSLHFIYNSHQTQVIKWYQTGFFQAVLYIAAIAIGIYFGPEKGVVVAAYAAGIDVLIMTLIRIIIVQIVKNMFWGWVLGKVAKIVGVENSFWIAAAAIVVGGTARITNSGLIAKTTAIGLLKAGTGLAIGAQVAMKDLIAGFNSEVGEFELLKEAQTKELQELQELLDGNLGLNPMNFVGKQPLVIWGEPVDAYINRTIHAGNIGVEGLNIIQNFVNISLRLPTMQETVGAPRT